MTTLFRKRKWWTIALIGVGFVYVVLPSTVWTMTVLHKWRAEQEAKQWSKQAEADAKPTWTEEDAIAWLHRHRFEYFAKATRHTYATGMLDKEFVLVDGIRQVEEGGLTVQITFVFDMNHNFEEVESRTWPSKPPPPNYFQDLARVVKRALPNARMRARG